jgi:hypothetical protein
MKGSARGVDNENKESAKMKSIFQGPTNPNFFKAAPKSKMHNVIVIDDVEVMVPLRRAKILNEESKTPPLTNINKKEEIEDISDEEIYVEPINPQSTGIEDQVINDSKEFDKVEVVSETHKRNDILPTYTQSLGQSMNEANVKDTVDQDNVVDNLVREEEPGRSNKHHDDQVIYNEKEEYTPSRQHESHIDSNEDAECYVESVRDNELPLYSRRTEKYDLEKLKRVIH